MKSILKTAFIISLSAIFFTACKEDKKTDQPTNTTGQFNINWEQIWATPATDFELNKALIHPKTNDQLTFATFKYYVSNVRLKKSDGTWWLAEESYHLLDQSAPNSLMLSFDKVPAGNYTAMQVTFGVDSIRNVSGAQTGALSPAHNMFWSWNSGYIMLKAEGSSPQAGDGIFAFHLGGFMGSDNVVVTRTFPFPGGSMTIAPNAKPEIHMITNPAKLFHTTGSVSNGPAIHAPGPEAVTMTSDYFGSIYLDHVHN